MGMEFLGVPKVVHPSNGGFSLLFPELEVEDVDPLKWFGCNEYLSDGSECTWLSSDGNSDNYPTWDDLQSLDASDFYFLDSSSRSSASETCDIVSDTEDMKYSDVTLSKKDYLVLDNSEAVEGLDFLISEENKREHFHMGCLESILSAEKRSSSYDSSSISGDSWASISTQDDPFHSQIQDFDLKSIQMSLLDLIGEDSDRDSDNALDGFDSDFPSPSYRANKSLHFQSSESAFDRYLGQASLFKTSDSFDVDEPLFWPFDDNSYSLLEFENNVFCTSPRKATNFCGIAGHQESRPIRNQHGIQHHRSKHQAQSGQVREQQCKKRACSNSVRGSRTRNSKCNTPNTSKPPLKLGRSNQVSSHMPLARNFMQTRLPQLETLKLKSDCNTKCSLSLPASLEAAERRFFVADEMLIERMVGLDEFDGNEGVTCELDLNWLSDVA